MSRHGSKSLLERIDQLDWKNADGITDRAKTGTNSMLAERDLTQRCDTKSEPIAVVSGFWLWYCFTHHQPSLFCDLRRSEDEMKRVKTEVVEAIKNSQPRNVVKP